MYTCPPYICGLCPSLPLFTTHPCNSNRWAPGCPPTKCAASVSAKAFLSCCELSRAKRNLSSNNGQHCRYRGWDVWQNPIKIHGEATKSIDLQKNNMRTRSIIQLNYVEMEFFTIVPHESSCFSFQTRFWKVASPQKNTSKSSPPGHERCEEQESHFHGPIFGCLGPTWCTEWWNVVVAWGQWRGSSPPKKDITPREIDEVPVGSYWKFELKLLLLLRSTSQKQIIYQSMISLALLPFLTTSPSNLKNKRPLKPWEFFIDPRPHTKRVPQVTPRSPMWFKVRSVVERWRWR